MSIVTTLSLAGRGVIHAQEDLTNHDCPTGIEDSGVVGQSTSLVNLRESASTNAEVLDQFPANARGRILAVESDTNGQVWYYVEMPNCARGYMRHDVFHPISETDLVDALSCVGPFSTLTYLNHHVHEWGTQPQVVPDSDESAVRSIKGLNAWLGYPSDGTPPESWKPDVGVKYGMAFPVIDWLYFYVELHLKNGETPSGQVDLYYSPETPDVVYSIVFTKESFDVATTDSDGDWLGNHPCAALVVPIELLPGFLMPDEEQVGG